MAPEIPGPFSCGAASIASLMTEIHRSRAEPLSICSAGRAIFFERGAESPRRGRLRPLWLHAIRRLEVFSGIGDELRVAWMIDGFHSDDDVHQLGVVMVNVLDQFGLRVGWSGNENRTGVCN